MDTKYTILDKYEISKDIRVSEGRLYIPANENCTCTQLLCDNIRGELLIKVTKEKDAEGQESFVVDFTKEEWLDDLITQFLEVREKSFSYSLFLVDGVKCRRIQDIRKNNVLVCEIMNIEKNGVNIVLGVYFQSGGNMNLILAKDQDLYQRSVNVFLETAKQQGNICQITCSSSYLAMLKEYGAECVRVELQALGCEERQGVEIKKCEVLQENEKVRLEISADIDFTQIRNLFHAHWNLALVFRLFDQEYCVPITNKKKNKKLRNFLLRESLLHSYKNVVGRNCAYLTITRSGRVRIYTGDLNNAVEYGLNDSFESLIRNPEVPFSREISAQILEPSMGQMKIQLMEASLEGVDEIALLVYKMAGVHILIVPVTILDEKAGICQVNTKDFTEICEGTGTAAYKFALAIRIGSRFMKGKIFDKKIYIETMVGRHGITEEEAEQEMKEEDDSASKDNVQDEHTIYMENIFSAKIDGETVDACPCTNNIGFFFMRMCSRKNMSIYKIVSEALQIHVSDSFLTIKAKCPDANRKWTGFLLSYHYQKEEDKDERFFAAHSIKKEGDSCIIATRIPLGNQEFKGIYWSIRAVFEEENERYCSSVKALKTELKESYKKLFQRNCKYYNVGKEKYILFPFVAKNGNISLMYRKTEGNDGVQFRLKERMGLRLYQVMKKRLKAQKIMLIYEKYCYMAEDNGYQFFKYCMDNDMENYLNRKIYYVIDKNSPDYQKVKKYDKNVLDFMSVKFIAYILAAKLLVSSDVRSHAYAWRHRSSIIAHVIQKKKHVFLQHGVTAMKKVDDIFGKANHSPTNLFIVTSDDEYDIVNKYLGYNSNEIALTGFARWDVLEDKSQGRREILLMPTWRNWLDDVDGETFRNSDYYKNYMELLNSKRLHDILTKYDVHMNFYIHPKFKDYIGNFQIRYDRIQLIPFGTKPLNELMMQCNMLITDYSSVSWDVYYMKKPVLFYQFDIDTYNQTHGSYMDMEHDLFGDRTLDLDELITFIEENIKNGFRLKPKYEEECKKNFKYMDKDNCKRICMVIKQKGY